MDPSNARFICIPSTTARRNLEVEMRKLHSTRMTFLEASDKITEETSRAGLDFMTCLRGYKIARERDVQLEANTPKRSLSAVKVDPPATRLFSATKESVLSKKSALSAVLPRVFVALLIY